MRACFCTLRQFKPIHFFLIIFGGGVIKLDISYILNDDACVDVCVDKLCFIVEDDACVKTDVCVDEISFKFEDDDACGGFCIDKTFSFLFCSFMIRISISTTNSFL